MDLIPPYLRCVWKMPMVLMRFVCLTRDQVDCNQPKSSLISRNILQSAKIRSNQPKSSAIRRAFSTLYTRDVAAGT
eukprot:298416-Rhodomonas_salina.1